MSELELEALLELIHVSIDPVQVAGAVGSFGEKLAAGLGVVEAVELTLEEGNEQ